MINEIWYQTETANGSKVKIKQWDTPGTAWVCGTKHTVLFVDLNDKDLEIQKSLNLPNWRFDYTGRGLVLEKGKQDWGVTKAHLEALELKIPWERCQTK